MAIISSFLRRSRFEEIEDCPLAGAGAADDNGACAGCRYNVLNSGKARVGCSINAAHDAYRFALGRLAQISATDHERLESILAEQRAATADKGLSREDLEILRDIAERWAVLVSNDERERVVVTTVQRFATAALETGEPVRILA